MPKGLRQWQADFVMSQARYHAVQIGFLSQRREEGTESFLKFTLIANWQKRDRFSLKHLLSKTSQSVNNSRSTFTDKLLWEYLPI